MTPSADGAAHAVLECLYAMGEALDETGLEEVRSLAKRLQREDVANAMRVLRRLLRDWHEPDPEKNRFAEDKKLIEQHGLQEEIYQGEPLDTKLLRKDAEAAFAEFIERVKRKVARQADKEPSSSRPQACARDGAQAAIRSRPGDRVHDPRHFDVRLRWRQVLRDSLGLLKLGAEAVYAEHFLDPLEVELKLMATQPEPVADDVVTLDQAAGTEGPDWQGPISTKEGAERFEVSEETFRNWAKGKCCPSGVEIKDAGTRGRWYVRQNPTKPKKAK